MPLEAESWIWLLTEKMLAARQQRLNLGFNLLHRGHRITHFNNQFVKAIIVKLNDDGLCRIVNVPKHALAIQLERARRDHARNLCTRPFTAMPPTGHVCGFGIVANV